MSPFLWLAVAVAMGDLDGLSTASLGGLSFKAPTQWRTTETEDTRTWAAPGGDAELAVSVYSVDPRRAAKVCLDQMVAALGTEGFEVGTVGAQPAAKKVGQDYAGAGADSGADEANRVTTATIVGCNGATKWVATYSLRTRLGPRFGPVFKRVLESMRYRR